MEPITDRPISQFTMKDGTVLILKDWTDTELRASFDLVATGTRTCWEPFSKSVEHTHEESGIAVSRADASIPCADHLPTEWEAMVFGWRATVDVPKPILESNELAQWLRRTSATLKFNQKSYDSKVLMDLTKAVQLVSDNEQTGEVDARRWLQTLSLGALTIPVHIRMNLNYGVTVECGDQSTLLALRALLGRFNERLLVRLHLRCWLARTVF